MKSDELKAIIQRWIDEGCNWEMGLALYAQHGKNKMLVRNIGGNPKAYSGKLAYELCKLVKIDYNTIKKQVVVTLPKPENNSMKKTVVTGNFQEVKEMKEFPEKIEIANIGQYPPIMRRVVMEYAETFQERSKTHRIMTEMPEGNGQALKMKREELFNLVKWFTGRLELLFEARETYEKNGQLPDENKLWPKPKEEAKAELPDDVDALKRMKKNQQSANVKDQNMLDYQSEKKGTKPSLMPAGPKRMRIENRIKGRVKLIEQIDYKLLSKDAR